MINAVVNKKIILCFSQTANTKRITIIPKTTQPIIFVNVNIYFLLSRKIRETFNFRRGGALMSNVFHNLLSKVSLFYGIGP
jgi:hypothetical protein